MARATSLSLVVAKVWPQKWGKEGKFSEPSTPLASMSATRSTTS